LEGIPTGVKACFGRGKLVPGKELRDMKFGQNLSQNGTKIGTFEPKDGWGWN
jgi:hypothetical protein